MPFLDWNWGRRVNGVNNNSNDSQQKDSYFIAFSIIAGIRRAKYGEESSRQGFVLTSISQGFRSSSSIKSYPKISNENCLRWGSSLRETALIVSPTNCLN